MTREDCANNAAAYVLGALEADEATGYARHLRACAVCREEAATFQRVADGLPMAAPQYPVPADLRRRLMRTVRSNSRRRRRPRLKRAPALAGASAVALAVVVAIAVIVSPGAAGPRLLDATVRGSSGTAELRINRGRGELIVHQLPAPPAGRIYEVWLARPHRAPSPTSALFSVTAGGASDVGIPGSLHGVSRVLVTQEPAGGSSVPTGPTVIVAPTS